MKCLVAERQHIHFVTPWRRIGQSNACPVAAAGHQAPQIDVLQSFSKALEHLAERGRRLAHLPWSESPSRTKPMISGHDHAATKRSFATQAPASPRQPKQHRRCPSGARQPNYTTTAELVISLVDGAMTDAKSRTSGLTATLAKALQHYGS
jgi:hypothetical protein